jgi:hypothetical protein
MLKCKKTIIVIDLNHGSHKEQEKDVEINLHPGPLG